MDRERCALHCRAGCQICHWAEHRQFPIIPCTLCGSQENLQRKQVGNLLRDFPNQPAGARQVNIEVRR